jgi:hypothetical protein
MMRNSTSWLPESRNPNYRNTNVPLPKRSTVVVLPLINENVENPIPEMPTISYRNFWFWTFLPVESWSPIVRTFETPNSKVLNSWTPHSLTSHTKPLFAFQELHQPRILDYTSDSQFRISEMIWWPQKIKINDPRWFWIPKGWVRRPLSTLQVL